LATIALGDRNHRGVEEGQSLPRPYAIGPQTAPIHLDYRICGGRFDIKSGIDIFYRVAYARSK
jgi:hypothetical protein